MGSIAAESSRSPLPPPHSGGGGLVVARPTRCLLLLQGCLAVKLQRVSNLVHPHHPAALKQGHEFWMYDSGYRLFQSFLDANCRCFWNPSLLEAMRQLQYQGYVAPGVLLVSADPCALEIIRAAWGRKTLQPPSNHIVTIVGDVEECLVQSLPQSQFTPLPEALCWVVLELTSAGQPASLEAVRAALQRSFPAVMETPSEHTIYDALAKLMQERKIYHTSRGYFVVTPESRRRRSNSQGRSSSRMGHSVSPHHRSSVIDSNGDLQSAKTVLMSTDEAVVYMHGEMETTRDGDKTHQAVQTNLADVICGGHPNDKVLYPRAKPTPSPGSRILERRHSMRLFGSKKRLSHSTSLPRCGSMRLSPTSSRTMDWGDVEIKPPEKSPSFLSRLFRRGKERGSSKRLSRADGSDSGDSNHSTFSAQFPPAEWFNPSVTHLHSVGTQTRTSSYSLSTTRSRDASLGRSQASLPWSEEPPSRAATLPRRRRHLSGDTNFTFPSGGTGCYSNTPRSSRKSSNSPSCHGTLQRAPSRQRSSSSSNGSKLTGSPGTSITGGAPSTISSTGSPRSKLSPTSSTLLSTPRLSPIKSMGSSPPHPRPVLHNGNSSLITLQVRTNLPSGDSSGRGSTLKTSSDVTTTTASISGNGSARVCVLQSPTKSVVTLNGSPVATPVVTPNHSSPPSVVESPIRRTAPRPSSCYLPKEKKTSPLAPSNLKCPSVENIPDELELKQKVSNYQLPTHIPKVSNSDAENHLPESRSMNNAVNADLGRKKSETLSSLKNLLYHSNTELNSLGNNSSSALKSSLDKPLKPSDSLNLLENLGKSSLSNGKIGDADSDLALDKINGDLLHSSFPSLSDLTVHFKSLTAQKILKGISINSIDTLVEVNMAAAAANEKQNNCDVTIHTDFGLL